MFWHLFRSPAAASASREGLIRDKPWARRTAPTHFCVMMFGALAVAAIAATPALAQGGKAPDPWRRPRLAGELLMLVAVTPVVGLVLGSMLSALLGVGGVTWQLPTSMAVVSLPAAALGVLHLLIGSATGHAEGGEPAS